MRKALLAALLAASAALPLRADAATRDRLSQYFAGWYSMCPGTAVTATEAADIPIAGYDVYRVERRCDAKNRNELSIALVDRGQDEVFVGEVLHSDERRAEPFSARRDIPVIEGALRDVYGLPVSILLGEGSRGSLVPIRVSIRQTEKASATMPGFVSTDGASVLLGEFRSLKIAPDVLRDRLLSDSPAVRPQKGGFFVTAFIDFQCEKCRHRTPELREFVAKQGGGLEIRFLPLVKVHPWAFAAAESAAALANVSPALYAKYEDALFPRAGAMTEAGARELAADVAEAAGAREAFAAELESGRASARVVRDIELAMRLGLNSTPVFFYRGAFLTSDPELAESYIRSRLPGRATPGPGASN